MAEVISIEIAAELKDAIKAFSEFQKTATDTFSTIQKESKKASEETKGFGASLKNIGTIAAGVLSADLIKGAFGALVGAFEAGVEEASKYEDALNQLNTALALSGNYSKATSASFEEFAATVQATTKFSDDAVLSAAALIGQIGRLGGQELQRATAATIDLAAALGMDLDSASRLVGKAAEGNIDTFKRYGIEIKQGKNDTETFANTLAVLEARFKGAAAAQANTFSGALEIAKNAGNDLLKSLGNLIINTPGIVAAIKMVGNGFSALSELINRNSAAIKVFITNYVRGILGAVAAVVDGINDLAKKFGKGIPILDDWSMKIAELTVGFEQTAVAVEKGPVQSFENLNKKAKESTKVLSETSDKLKDVKKDIAAFSSGPSKGIVAIAIELSATLKATTEGFLGQIDPLVAKAVAVFAGSLAAAFQGKEGAAKFVSGLAASVADAFLPGIGAAVGPIFDALAKGPDFVREQLNAFFTELPNVISNIIQALPELLISLVEGIFNLSDSLPEVILNAFLSVIDRLPEYAERLAIVLTQAFLSATFINGVTLAFIKALPRIIQAFIMLQPMIAKSFITAVINEAPRFIDELIREIKGAFEGIVNAPGKAVGGFVNDVKSIFGFADGGRVPNLASFSNDGGIARVSAGEQILSKDLSGALENFLSGGGSSQNMTVNLVIGEQQLANVILNLNRQGFRTA